MTVCIVILSLAALYLLASFKAFYIHLHRYPSGRQRKYPFTIPGIPDMTPYKSLCADCLARWNAAGKQELTLTSYDGIPLSGVFFPHPAPRGVVVLVHGYHCTGKHDYWDLFGEYLDRGFAVLTFDQRGCGRSGDRYITMGVKESRDTAAWCEKAAELCPGVPLLLHGMSMGGATALMTLPELKTEVRALVIDCAYCTPYETVGYVFREYPGLLIRALLPGVELFARLCAGFSLRAKSTEDILKHDDHPVLFLHGDPDGLVPTGCTVRNAAAAKGPHEVLYIPGAGHTECFLYGREQALRALDGFLERYFFSK